MKKAILLYKPLLAKFKESLLSVLPITLIVIILNFFIPLGKTNIIGLLVGTVMLIIGMSFFNLGADMSMIAVGSGVGKFITKQKKMWLVLLVPFLIGTLVTIAEPDLQLLAANIEIPNLTVIIVVALGVGLFLMVAILRIILRIDIRIILFFSYIVLFVLAIFTPNSFIPFAFDSGGATTGPMTVPFILALGVGVASVASGSKNSDDNFGYVALCSVGPVLMVLILGLIWGDVSPDITEFSEVTNFGEYVIHNIVDVIKDVCIALAPILLFVIVFEIFIFRENKKSLFKIFLGLFNTFIGLVIFLAGANIGFVPIGNFIGRTIIAMENNWIIIPIGMVMGFFVVMAEPAVHVLNNQVENVTGGAISKTLMLISLAIGVSIAIGFAMARVVFDFSILWVIIPGYLISLGLMFVVPKTFTCIAFDSGGVASGPMTSSFLLQLAAGACAYIFVGDADKIAQNGFGIVALVAMTPLIVIQLLGVVYQVKMERRIKSTPFVEEQVIDFGYVVNTEVCYEF